MAPAGRRKGLLIAAQVVLAAVAFWYIGRDLADQWGTVRRQGFRFDLRWGWVAVSGVLVLCAYAVLIETWRRMLDAWASSLPFAAAARIWFVSNLGRYVPGKIWGIGAMAAMAERENVRAEAAAGSSILINAINLLAGFAVVAVTGAKALDWGGAAGIAIGVVVVGLAGCFLVLPRILPFVGRVTGRDLQMPARPGRASMLALVGSVIAWVIYGLAFQCLAIGVLGAAAGSPASYIAVYTSSYLIGYIVLVAPGGLVVRERAMYDALGALELTSPGEAASLLVASRLWLTILEILPGALFLAGGALRGGNAKPRGARDG